MIFFLIWLIGFIIALVFAGYTSGERWMDDEDIFFMMFYSAIWPLSMFYCVPKIGVWLRETQEKKAEERKRANAKETQSK